MTDAWQVTRRKTFDRVPAIYHAIRPGYPDALFDALFARLPTRPEVLEVGPGTGQATTGLLANGAAVHAVELGPSMAATLRAVLPDPRLTVTVGNFELVPTGAAVYDGVVAATAYHWITAAAQLDRPAELLVPGGLLAVVDMVQVDSPNDGGFFAAVRPIYERYEEHHIGPPAPARPDVRPAIAAALSADPRYGPVEVERYDWDQTYSAAQYRQLMLSYSATQAMAPAARAGLLDDVARFVDDRFGGTVTRPLVAALTTARLVAPAARPVVTAPAPT